MYLKQIDIHGFKSFAEKTSLVFLPPKNGVQSVTAVVGPNGSGKSNISDAIRWVMGEQSMKHLRGKKSADIIFSGSEAKGKMGMASVTLTLDNTSGRADLDYEELVITRRLYRSGDSDYMINGHKVRLLDLQLLLAKAQFGQGSYAVVGQGMIDKMLLQSAAERKTFFDEASGIKEFQIKRHQSALKLRRTTDHIEQATLLLQEISPRLKTLARQVKKLEERQDLEVQLREAQEQYYTTLWTHYQTESTLLQDALKTIDAEYEKHQKELETIQTELATLAAESSRQEAFEKLQQTYQQVAKQKNNLERERAVLQGRLQTEYSKVGKQNVGWLENKIEELKGEQNIVAASIKELEQKQAELQKALSEKKQAQEKRGVKRTELRGKLAQLQQLTMQVKSEQSLHQFTGLRAVQAVLEHRHELKGVLGAVAQLARVEKEYQLALDVAAGGHISSIVVEDDSNAQACIEYLRRNQLGYATFLPQSKIKPRFIPQDIYEFIGREGVHGLAIDLVEFDKKLESIFSYVFGSTLVVDDIATARRIGIGRVRMVTLDGDILETSGSMKGGYRKRGGSHRLSFADTTSPSAMLQDAGKIEEEIKDVRRALEQAEIDYESEVIVIREEESDLGLLNNRVTLAREREQALGGEAAGLEQELARYSMSPKEYNASMKQVASEQTVLEDRMTKVDKELAAAEKAIEQFNAEEEKKKQRVFALQEAMQAAQQALNKIVDERNSKKIGLAKYETKQEDLMNEVYQEMHLAVDAIMKRNQDTVPLDELDHVQASIQKMKYKLNLIGGIDEEVIAEYEETKARHDGLSTQLDDLHKAMNDLESLIEELDKIMKKKRDKAFKEIRKEFQRYFSILFEGGKADLVEIYGEEKDPEEEELEEGAEELEEEAPKKKKRKKKILTGIDVSACPPGKKIKNLQSLSGGERTMTSIALICAILHTNPSPFVVLDEVEAALDEANSLRFTNIIQDLKKQSQFILITHNRVTMHAADALYGVTMGNDGISHLLSVKLEEAEKTVEEK